MMSERRVAILFAVVAAALLALLAVQAPQRVGEITLRMEGPIKRLVAGGVATIDRLRRERTTIRSQEREIAALRDRVRELEAANAAKVGARLEVDLLSKSLRYEPPPDAELVTMDVVHVDHRSLRRTAILHLPRRQRDEDWTRRPVTTADGLLGRIISAGGDYARVLLVTDRASSVGAMVERTRRQGIVRGTESAGTLSLVFLPLSVDVRPGDRVITAGIDGVFPRGIPIGTIASVAAGGDLFHEILVVPSVDLGSLSHAFVWRRDPVPELFLDGRDGVGR